MPLFPPRDYPRDCLVCGTPFVAKHNSTRVCSEPCRVKRKADVYKRWADGERDRLRAYWRKYHAEHRPYRNEMARKNARLRLERPGYAELLKERRKHYVRIYRRRGTLVFKVMREWKVDSEQAKSWIEQGTFPP